MKSNPSQDFCFWTEEDEKRAMAKEKYRRNRERKAEAEQFMASKRSKIGPKPMLPVAVFLVPIIFFGVLGFGMLFMSLALNGGRFPAW